MFYPNEFCCFLCNLKLGTIYIKCMECSQLNDHLQASNNQDKQIESNICLRCFANGTERDHHENCHSYKIIDLSRIETFDGWTVQQELQLLNILEDTKCDIQLSNLSSIETNWSKISKVLNVNPFPQNNLNEFYTHVEAWLNMIYNKPDNQISSICSNSIEKLTNEFYTVKNAIKSGSKKSETSKDLESGSCKNMPMRPYEHTIQFRKMNGYRPARGDFETEFMDNFEMKFVSNLDFETDLKAKYNSASSSSDENFSSHEDNDDQILETDLKLTTLDAYTSLIAERNKRKQFIRDFGLLNELQSNQTIIFNEKLNYLNLQQHWSFNNLRQLSEKELLAKVTLPVKFQRFFDNLEDYLKHIELVSYQVYLAKKIEELQEYRKMGIASLKHATTYKSLKIKRLNHTQSVFMSSLFTSLNRDHQPNHKTLNTDQFKEWFKQLVISEKSLNEKKSVFTANYQAACKNNPLKIENYPEFEKLGEEEEREFCRVARVQPAVFIRVKSILLLEYSKAGCCSYSRARKIAGIDVNKTRLIHNLLVNNGVIKATLT